MVISVLTDTVTGNLNTKGKVVIGPTGKIKGEVICKNSEISGIIEGKIIVGPAS